jgi:hypothetical protein
MVKKIIKKTEKKKGISRKFSAIAIITFLVGCYLLNNLTSVNISMVAQIAVIIIYILAAELINNGDKK